MVSVEEWAEVRRLGLVDGLSIREISRRTGLHRATVRRALHSAVPPVYSRPAKCWIGRPQPEAICCRHRSRRVPRRDAGR